MKTADLSGNQNAIPAKARMGEGGCGVLTFAMTGA